jgi:23S rRNA pseudouridine1911/1915/1917 synthase
MSNPKAIEPEIIYEDADIAAVNKPAGLIVHSDGRNTGPFLTDWVTMKFPDAVLADEPLKAPDGSLTRRPGIVHRLDRDTSGALLIAKTPAGYASLKDQFRDKTIVKKYLAFVWGEIKEEFGTITRPIGRNGSDFRRWSAQPGARGEIREAETYWTRLWTGEAGEEIREKREEKREEQEMQETESKKAEGQKGESKTDKFSLIQAEPKTGRTHQIRVHFLAIHHPIVCDALYAEKRPPALGFKRLALHSRSIGFNTTAGKHLEISAPLPEDFEKAVEELRIKI